MDCPLLLAKLEQPHNAMGIPASVGTAHQFILPGCLPNVKKVPKAPTSTNDPPKNRPTRALRDSLAFLMDHILLHCELIKTARLKSIEESARLHLMRLHPLAPPTSPAYLGRHLPSDRETMSRCLDPAPLDQPARAQVRGPKVIRHAKRFNL